MNPTAALAVVLALLIVCVGWLSTDAWRAFTVVVDTEPPEIDREATTHGWVGNRDKVTIRLVVRENLELDTGRVKVKVTPPNRAAFDVSMTLVSRSGRVWTFQSRSPVDIAGWVALVRPIAPRPEEPVATVYYEVYDKAGNRDYWLTHLYFMQPEDVTAKVYLNGREVTKTSKVYLQDPRITLRVDVISGWQYVSGAYFTVGYYDSDGRWLVDKVEMSRDSDFEKTYTLPYPSDNTEYPVNVYLTLVDAEDPLNIASLNIHTGFKLDKIALYTVGALAAVLATGYAAMRLRRRR